jgi:hypothetical protein
MDLGCAQDLNFSCVAVSIGGSVCSEELHLVSDSLTFVTKNMIALVDSTYI